MHGVSFGNNTWAFWVFILSVIALVLGQALGCLPMVAVWQCWGNCIFIQASCEVHTWVNKLVDHGRRNKIVTHKITYLFQRTSIFCCECVRCPITLTIKMVVPLELCPVLIYLHLPNSISNHNLLLLMSKVFS